MPDTRLGIFFDRIFRSIWFIIILAILVFIISAFIPPLSLSGNYLIILDTSGSMRHNSKSMRGSKSNEAKQRSKLDEAKQSIEEYLKETSLPGAKFGLRTFAGGTTLDCPIKEDGEKCIRSKLEGLAAGGDSPMGIALKKAKYDFEDLPEWAPSWIIIISDWDVTGKFCDNAKELKNQGVRFKVIDLNNQNLTKKKKLVEECGNGYFVSLSEDEKIHYYLSSILNSTFGLLWRFIGWFLAILVGYLLIKLMDLFLNYKKMLEPGLVPYLLRFTLFTFIVGSGIFLIRPFYSGFFPTLFFMIIMIVSVIIMFVPSVFRKERY